jgi:hypothetical protein
VDNRLVIAKLSRSAKRTWFSTTSADGWLSADI